jgi:hypothetical protein
MGVTGGRILRKNTDRERENRILKRMLGPKRNDSYNEELHNLYTSTNIIGAINSKRMRWAGHLVCMEK